MAPKTRAVNCCGVLFDYLTGGPIDTVVASLHATRAQRRALPQPELYNRSGGAGTTSTPRGPERGVALPGNGT